MRIVIKETDNQDFDYIVYVRTKMNTNIEAELSTKKELKTILDRLTIKYNTPSIEFESKDIITTDTPLILVLYLDRGLFTTPGLEPFIESVNKTVSTKSDNILVFFAPTDTNERIECINPRLINENQKLRIDNLINSLEEEFQIDRDFNLSEDED